MKSIMEEASSIAKAIEKGWANAGKPKEFSVKIYEEPQKNFIGMTVKPAKIGIFFTETPPAKGSEQPRSRKERPGHAKEEIQRQPRERTQTQPRPPRTIREAPKKETAHEEIEERGPVWTDEMIASAQKWVTEILTLIDAGHVPFTVQADRFHLKMEFAGKLYEDKNREKHLFASLSHLVLTMLKRAYKRPLKGYKIVLTGP